MASGAGSVSASVTVPEATATAFKDMKQKRKYRWMQFRLTETFDLEVAKTGAPSEGVKDFVKALPDTEARFAVYDLPVTNKYGGSGSKLILFLWAPPTAGRHNMMYSSQRRSVDSFFTGVEDRQVTNKKAVEDALGGKVEKEDSDFDPDA